MKEYTILAVICVLGTLWLDRFSGMNVLKRREFYVFFAIIIFFKLLVNGYLTGAHIVLYNPRYYLGVRIGSIPIEDFLFGFGMVVMTIIFWEYCKSRERT
ncbi:MAG: lycopene cyclase domain-containing protein [Candidatus Omnitrophota bacterium]